MELITSNLVLNEKNIIILLMACSYFATFGQNSCTSDSTYSNISYNILRPLDKTQISTGILIDYVFPMATLENYDGSANTDTSDISHFEEAYAELYHSMLNNYGKIHHKINFISLENILIFNVYI